MIQGYSLKHTHMKSIKLHEMKCNTVNFSICLWLRTFSFSLLSMMSPDNSSFLVFFFVLNITYKINDSLRSGNGAERWRWKHSLWLNLGTCIRTWKKNILDNILEIWIMNKRAKNQNLAKIRSDDRNDSNSCEKEENMDCFYSTDYTGLTVLISLIYLRIIIRLNRLKNSFKYDFFLDFSLSFLFKIEYIVI